MTKTVSTADLLAQLNVLRVAAGKTELKSWKKSRADLEAAVAALTPAKPAKTKKPAAEKKQRLFAKGVFKSKVPAMKDERGKVWLSFNAKLMDDRIVEAKMEKTGSYFYLFLDGVCYSGKFSDFAKVPADKVELLDLTK